MTDFFSTLGSRWQSWAAIVLICVGLEACAVFFQEVLMYYPCELCIYTRVWMTSMALAAVIAIPFRNNLKLMRTFIVLQLILVVGLGHTVWHLVSVEYGFDTGGACSLTANFPSWAPLDEWFPVLFQVQESCGKTPLVVGSLSMADGLVGTVLGFFVVLSLSLFYSFKKS